MATGPAEDGSEAIFGDEAIYEAAVEKYGFKRISCSDIMPPQSCLLDDQTKTTIIRNIQILKDLPSVLKLPIILKCVKNIRSDYVGLRYCDLYDPRLHSKPSPVFNLPNQENQRIHEKTRISKKELVICRKKRPLCPSDYGHEEQGKQDLFKKPKKKKKKQHKEAKHVVADGMLLQAPPALPAQVRNKIRELNGIEENLVITKQLYWSDVCRNNNRFSLPLKQINDNFLRAEERELLNTRIGGKVPVMEVRLLQEGGKVTKLSLRRWDMFKTEGKVTSTYNLVGKWCVEVVEKMKLREGMMVQLWSFQVASTVLWFALAIVTAN